MGSFQKRVTRVGKHGNILKYTAKKKWRAWTAFSQAVPHKICSGSIRCKVRSEPITASAQ